MRSQRPDQNSVCFLRSDVQHAELPALAVVALEILVGLGHVGDVHVGRVLENFLSGEAIEVTACIGSYPSRINDMSITCQWRKILQHTCHAIRCHDDAPITAVHKSNRLGAYFGIPKMCERIEAKITTTGNRMRASPG